MIKTLNKFKINMMIILFLNKPILVLSTIPEVATLMINNLIASNTIFLKHRQRFNQGKNQSLPGEAC